MQQFKEIDARLQEIVPKIAEVNTLCREYFKVNASVKMFSTSQLLSPKYNFEVKADGSKISRV